MTNKEKLIEELDYLRTSEFFNYNGIKQCVEKNIGSCETCMHAKSGEMKNSYICEEIDIYGSSYVALDWFCSDYEKRK